MKVAVFGAKGFLGNKLIEFFSKKEQVFGADVTPGYKVEKVDATNKLEIEKFLLKIKPDVVVDTVALTSSVACEKNPNFCKKLNYETAKNIFGVCNKINAKMIFISSSYVFDGEKGEYQETDQPNPQNQYAKMKVLAEQEILKSKNSLVIRIEPLYGYDPLINKIKFGSGTFDKGVEVGYLNLIRNPTFIEDVPQIIYFLLEKNLSGIFHIAGPEKINWLEFLKRLALPFGFDDKIKVVGGSNWLVKSPLNSTLSISKINSLGIKTTSLDEALKKISSLVK